MKSVIIGIFVSLLYTRLAASVAILSPPAIRVVSPNSTTLADDRDTTHCSSDHASYGQMQPGTLDCFLASQKLLESPSVTRKPNNYPLDFRSSTAPDTRESNVFRTPWRSTFGECTVAVAVLIEVPARFIPEASGASSGQNGLVFKSAFLRAINNLQTCFISPHGTNIGWVKAQTTWIVMGRGKVGIFAFKNGSPIDRAIPDGPRVSSTLSSNLTADLTVERRVDIMAR